MDPETIGELFPVLSGELGLAFGNESVFKAVPKGTVMYEGGFPCPYVPFIIKGAVRVFKLGESGREITLYRVLPGQVCVLSSTCSLSGSSFPAIAEAEEDLEMVVLPAHIFRSFLDRFPDLQSFINERIAERLSDLMVVVEEVAFRRVDIRLVEKLLKEAATREGGTVECTHAQLAQELGSAREVISRILKDLENHDLIKLGRGRIEVINPTGLADHHRILSGGSPN